MTPFGAFDRVYSAIKQRLMDGFYLPGSKLESGELADELGASITPVREALQRLTGERLVEEAQRHDGFRTPMMTESTLRQLYDWHFDLVMLAVMKHRALDLAAQTPLEEARSNEPARIRQNAWFLALARENRNPELAWSLRNLTERLGPVQRLEATFLDDTEAETNAIVEALQAHDRKVLRRKLVDYHRRRKQLVPELLASLLGTS